MVNMWLKRHLIINREWGWKRSRTRGCHLLLLYPLPLFNHTESWAPQVKKELVSPSLLIPYTHANIWFSKIFPAYIDPEKNIHAWLLYLVPCGTWNSDIKMKIVMAQHLSYMVDISLNISTSQMVHHLGLWET